jgi:hypothetical protein
VIDDQRLKVVSVDVRCKLIRTRCGVAHFVCSAVSAAYMTSPVTLQFDDYSCNLVVPSLVSLPPFYFFLLRVSIGETAHRSAGPKDLRHPC